jgi:CRISPR-associated protein Cmr6
MSNLGWIFYKDYFRGIDYADLDNPINKETIQNKVKNIINQSVSIVEDEMLGNTHFKATTTYPGLILGSGNAHELPSIEGQAILGFHFDYTSGLPVIQGSSIKGVLRSAFRHPAYITEYVGEGVDIEALEKEIFDNADVFFDATIISNGKILGDDFITPHGDNPLKNPIPLRFIKVLPNVTFRFDFELSDGLISKEKKTILFAEILLDLGIGAKTNVGYGKFNSNLVSKAKLAIDSQKKEALKKKKEREEKELLEQQEKELESLDSTIAKIKVQIKKFTKKETKDIYEVIEKYSLNEEERKEIIVYLNALIGEKPAPKNKAPIKWAIKIYEFLGV